MKRLRYALIRLLAGRATVILNAEIEEGLICLRRGGLVYGNTFAGPLVPPPGSSYFEVEVL